MDGESKGTICQGTTNPWLFPQMEALIQELQCPVCLDLYKNPTILPCSHILCGDCAAQLFDRSFVRCPVCRESSFVSGGLENLPQVKTLVNIIDRYQNGGSDVPAPMDVCGASDQPCHLCRGTPKKAYRRCIDCKAAYCRMCLELSHPNKEPFLQHHLVETTKNMVAGKLQCPVHEQVVNIFCDNCRVLGCLLCADSERSNHRGHRILSLQQAYDRMKELVEDGVQKLEEGQICVKGAIKAQKSLMEQFQGNINESKANIQSQCDTLIQEIQMKRVFFLSDLEYEEKSENESLQNQMETFQKKDSNIRSVLGYAKEVLNETDPASFLQLANTLVEKIDKAAPETSFTWKGSVPSLKHRVVDTRKERAVIRDLTYLTVPATPSVDVSKCARSTTSVVIVLYPPNMDQDVIDGYKVYYSSPEQRESGQQETVLFETPMEERRYSRGALAASTVCLIHNNLVPETVYCFSVRAYNLAGESPGSDEVNCTTLSESEADSTLPKPEISESMCRMYTTSIQVYSTSPMDYPEESPTGITHYLLYRESGGRKLWKSISLCGRLDHRVFGLEPDTLYDFVIMACDKKGQCQVSNEVSLKTERAAY